MLNKLLKNEFIATGRIMGVVYAVMGLLLAYFMGSYAIHREETTSTQALSIIVLVLISGCNIFFTAIVMIMNFQKSLYSDQGYLSFTLPVKGSTLLTSKVITSVVWFVAAIATFIGTCVVVFFTVKEDVLGEETYSMVESLLPMFLSGKSLVTLITTLLIQVLGYFVKMTMITVELYFAISLANTRKFQKHYLLWTIVFILVITFVTQQLSDIVSANVEFGLSVLERGFGLVTNSDSLVAGAGFVDLTSLIVSVIFGAVFYYATFYVMNKKVNIG